MDKHCIRIYQQTDHSPIFGLCIFEFVLITPIKTSALMPAFKSKYSLSIPLLKGSEIVQTTDHSQITNANQKCKQSCPKKVPPHMR